MTTTTVRGMANILDVGTARSKAVAFATMYGEPYVVQQYDDGFDVSPWQQGDTIGLYNIIYITEVADGSGDSDS